MFLAVPVVPVTTPETSVPVVPVVPVSMKVIKVRVENPNGVDLNDPAFLDAMLVEVNHVFYFYAKSSITRKEIHMT